MGVVAGQVGQGLGAVLHALAQKLVLAIAAGEDGLGVVFPGGMAGAGADVGDEAGLDAAETAQTPLGVGDLSDELEFEGVLGEDVLFELLELAVVLGGVLVGHDGVAGEEAVFEAVL